MADFAQIGAVWLWDEFGDADALAKALEALDGRAPDPALVTAIAAALRGEKKPRKRRFEKWERDRDMRHAVKLLCQLGMVGTKEQAYCTVAEWFSVSSHTVEKTYKTIEKEKREQRARRKR